MVRNIVRKHFPKIDSIWHSSTKPADKHPSSFRAKLVVAGDKACPCVNMAGDGIPLPSDWVGLSVIPILSIRAAYVQRNLAGLVIEVTSLLVGEAKRTAIRNVTFV